MPYSEDELRAAGTALATSIRGLGSRLEALEGKPALDAWQQQWTEGQRFARTKGYGAEELTRLEDEMVARGVSRHQDMVALDPTPPSGKNWFLGGIPADEMALAMDGRIDEMTNLAIARSRRGE